MSDVISNNIQAMREALGTNEQEEQPIVLVYDRQLKGFVDPDKPRQPHYIEPFVRADK